MSSYPVPALSPSDVPLRLGDRLTHWPFAWQQGARHEGTYAQGWIELKSGQRAIIEISEVRGTTGDAVIYVVRDDEVLAWDDDSGPELQPRIVFEAPSDGVYRIRARAFSRGAYGTCTLTLKPDTSSR
jgi:hypothetical protein